MFIVYNNEKYPYEISKVSNDPIFMHCDSKMEQVKA